MKSLKLYIGDENFDNLANIINKIARNEIQPKLPKAIKMPPSWIMDDRQYQGVIITPPNYHF